MDITLLTQSPLASGRRGRSWRSCRRLRPGAPGLLRSPRRLTSSNRGGPPRESGPSCKLTGGYTYTFKTSAAFPGQYGLFRTVQGAAAEEVMAPFDSSARFKYWTRSAAASVSSPPALALIRGVDVVFASRALYTPLGKTAPPKTTVVASIFFKNVRPF